MIAVAENTFTHKLVSFDGETEICREFTFDEWAALIWSDNNSRQWCLTIDGVDYHDHGSVRVKSLQHCDNYPMASYAVGVGISQVPEQMKADKQAGVPTEYTKAGDPIFVSRSHRKRYLKHVGFHDRNSYDGN
jgi:hypothetical protein